VLVALAVASLIGACAIGVWAAFAWDEPALLAFVAVGGLATPAYNIEWLGGSLHNAWGFALTWGAFPLLTAYFASAERLRAEAVAAAGFAFLASLAQRTLSTEVRFARRAAADPGSARPAETALKLLAAALPLLAGALLLSRSG